MPCRSTWPTVRSSASRERHSFCSSQCARCGRSPARFRIASTRGRASPFPAAPLGNESVAHDARPGSRPDAAVGDVGNLRQHRVVPVALDDRALVRIRKWRLGGCEKARPHEHAFRPESQRGREPLTCRDAAGGQDRNRRDLAGDLGHEGHRPHQATAAALPCAAIHPPPPPPRGHLGDARDHVDHLRARVMGSREDGSQVLSGQGQAVGDRRAALSTAEQSPSAEKRRLRPKGRSVRPRIARRLRRFRQGCGRIRGFEPPASETAATSSLPWRGHCRARRDARSVELADPPANGCHRFGCRPKRI